MPLIQLPASVLMQNWTNASWDQIWLNDCQYFKVYGLFTNRQFNFDTKSILVKTKQQLIGIARESRGGCKTAAQITLSSLLPGLPNCLSKLEYSLKLALNPACGPVEGVKMNQSTWWTNFCLKILEFFVIQFVKYGIQTGQLNSANWELIILSKFCRVLHSLPLPSMWNV